MDFKKIEEFVKETFGDSAFKHIERTVYWVNELEPKASESLKIAALMHDIERPFRVDSTKNLVKQHGFDHPEFLKAHQHGGAEIAKTFLLKNGCDERFSEEVSEYIKHHEVGGSREKDILMDADSLSFLEDKDKIESFIEKIKSGESDKEKVRRKFVFMYNRIKSKKAKEIAKPFYEKATKELEKIK